MYRKPVIVFEGIEGSGKSYHITNISNYLRKKKLETFYFKQFLNKSKLIKEASFHAPAVSIALLLQRLK